MEDRIERNARPTRLGPADFGRSKALWDIEHGAEGPSILTWEQAVRVLRKHRWFLIGSIGCLTLLIVAGALLMRDVYRPIARLEIDPLGGGITTLHEIQNPNSEGDQDYLDTQVQILQSEGLAMRVIRALRLDENPEFASKQKTSASTASAKQPATASLQGNEGSYLHEQLDLATTTTAEASALRTFHQQLTVSPIRGSRLVEVSFTSHDPKLAQNVTNSLVTQFIDQNSRNRYLTTMEASAWLSSQLNDLRAKMVESNQAVAEYQKRYGLVESDARDVPLGQLMGEVSRQLSDAQADRIQAEASARMIGAGQADALPALRDDVVYQNLLTHYAETRSQLAQAQTVYGDESTNVKKLKGESDELAAQVDAERGRLINRVKSSFAAAKDREQMMIQARDKLRSQMGDASSRIVEFEMLKNEAIANAALYNTLQARLREAGIYAGLRSGNISVVDLAPALETPTGPHRTLIIASGFALSALLALVLAFIWESLNNTVRIPDDIRNWLCLPSLAVVPKINSIANGNRHSLPGAYPASQFNSGEGSNDAYPKLFWSNTQTAEAEAIRTLRSVLIIASLDPAPRVTLVSSPSAGEGKTTVALNLASVLAQHGTTCLVEGDLRRPMIESALRLRPSSGLSEVLAGKQTVNDALISVPGVPGLSVLPIKRPPNNPADMLASDQMRIVLDNLCTQFHHVVIDSPPMLPFSDARTLAALSDAVILVSRCGRTTRRAITRSVEMLAEVHAPLLGVVLNDMDFASADFHYFNYGYSWAMTGRKYKQTYNPFVSPIEAEEKEPEKSKGAHA
jgi:capsular exopolysaccharide synthesis family protein